MPSLIFKIHRIMKKYVIWILLLFLEYKGDAQSNQATTTVTTIEANGIRIPSLWHPRDGNNEVRRSMDIPYLKSIPSVIPINIGRQLFVDDFLIEKTTLTRINYQPKYYTGNPILKPDKPWEWNKTGPYAAPFSDGVWFDEKTKKYKIWYLAGAGKDKKTFQTCYAESVDGIHWLKPDLNIYGDNNIVDTSDRDAATIWLDKNETNLNKRFKLFLMEHRIKDNRWQIILKYSADGIHFSKGEAQSGDMYDRTTVFFNPFLKKWVMSIKAQTAIGRARNYLENTNLETLVSLAHRTRPDIRDENIVPWFGADDKDPHNPNFPEIKPQIYNFDAMPYESIMLGYFVVWQGPENNVCEKLGIQKRNQVFIGYSRDGFHWDKPSRQAFMGVNQKEGAWNWGNVQSVVGCPIIKDDSLYFYVSGRGLNNSSRSWDSNMSTGLATLRRDGFISMETKSLGTLTTRCVSFNGNYLFINADIQGSLKVEVLDSNNNKIQGYSADDCLIFRGNKTKQLITWKNQKNVSSLKDRPVKFKFYINNGSLYSFWVSPWETGESRGYKAGGGPDLSGTGIDTKH